MSANPLDSKHARRLLPAAAVLALMLPAAASWARPAKNRIEAVDAGEINGATAIAIRGSKTPTFTVYKLKRPNRVVIDIANAELAKSLRGSDGTASFDVNSWGVSQVSAHEVTRDGAQSTIRVVVRMARPGSYKVKAVGDDVVVEVTPRDEPPKAVADAAAKAEAKRAQAEAKRAKADAKRAKAEAKRAVEEAEKLAAQARAAEAKAKDEAYAARLEASQARAAARKARDEVDQARNEAKAAKLRAQQYEATADARVKEAKAMLAEADRKLAAARETKADAEKAEKIAGQRSAEAKAEANRAQKTASEARAEARRLQQAAEKAAKDGRENAKELERKAEEAAEVAERHRSAAEKAAARADERRAEAEAAAAEAKRQRKAAVLAAKQANDQRKLAESRRRKAEQGLDKAKQDLADAEKRRTAAEQNAADARARADKIGKSEQKAIAAAREARKTADGLKAELTAAQERVEVLRSEKVQTEARLARLTKQHSKNKAELAQLRAERERTNNEVNALREEREKLLAAQQLAEKKAAEAAAATRVARTAKRAAEQKAEASEAKAAAAEQKAAAAERAARAARAEAARAERTASDAAAKQAEAAEQKAAEAAAATRAARTARRAAEQRAEAEANKAAAAEKRAAAAEREAKAARAEAARAERSAREAAAHKADAWEVKAAAAEKRAAAAEREAKAARAEAARAERSARDAAAHKADEWQAKAAAAEKRAAAAEREAKAARAEAARAERSAKDAAAHTADEWEAKAAAAEKRAAAAEREAKAARAAVERTEKPAARERAAVREVDYVDRGGVARVVINLEGKARPKVLSAKGRKAILEIEDASIADDLERTLDTTRYGGPISAVSSYRDPRDPNKVRVVVDLNKPTASVLKRKGTVYYWDFDKPKAAAAPKQPVAPAPKTPAASVGTSTPINSKTVAQSSRRRKVYRGRKIDLDFKDADIHNLLRLLADVGGVNIVIPDEIRATVTVRLRNVPWDQALEVILQSKGLWYRREGSLIRIASRKLLDAEDKAEAERIASLARSEAPEPEVYTLNYSVAGKLRPRLVPLLSPKGRIEVDQRTNSLIINDIRAHRRRVIQLVDRLDTQTPQIQIEARIVEARTSFRREFGIQWGGRGSATQAGGNATGLIFPSDVVVAGAADDGQTNGTGVAAVPTDFAVNLPAAIGSGAGGGLGFTFGSVGGNFGINLRLSAAEDQGSIRIVSAPKITTLNNIQASISQGVSIPISVISANGVQTQFVPADLSLKVTPHVSQRDCTIAMDLQVTKNEADFANTGARGDPSLLRKEARTSILVADGETAVIGGVYTRSTGWSKSKVPFFADLPFIGWLFRNKTESDERTEVLVFITPKITNRAFLRCE